MKKLLSIVAVVLALGLIGVVTLILLMPWMDSWGATQAEISAAFPGDGLLASPAVFYNRAVTIKAAPEEIYPWIVQLGAGRGGMYSYDWLETNLLRCELVNADSIHPEWQDLKVGDLIKMCPGDWGPPPYQVALIDPNHAMVIGHQENGRWVDIWQFILIRQADGSTCLVLRLRDTKTGGIWDVMRPGEFIMSRGMLLGIKERAEAIALVP